MNDGQNKFEVHISKNMAKIADFQPKIGQDATFAPTFNGHNSAIFIRLTKQSHDLIAIKHCTVHSLGHFMK